VALSDDSASASIAAVWPSSTASGSVLPGVQIVDAPVVARGCGAAIPEQRHRIDRVGMETQHLFGRAARQ
jgi:hypothetical protein